jgi:probable rRNA maturation factor
MIVVQVAESIISTIDPAVINSRVFENAAHAALEHQNALDGDLTILLTDDVQVQELNRTYLEEDAPTDVLSFPAGYTDPDTDSPYLGDVIISYPRAGEQAKAGGHPIHHELGLLVVHGVLHLLGYDHIGDEEKALMWAAQGEILARLHNPLSPP